MALLQRTPSQVLQSTFLHFSHPNHPLTEVYIAKEYICDACNTPGYGKSYRCTVPTFDFDLHECCASWPPTIGCHQHPSHRLTLVNITGTGYICDFCGDVVEGLFYTCSACDFDIHPLCTQVARTVQSVFHPNHLLTLRLVEPRWCVACRQPCSSWRYRCDVDLHVECALGSGSGAPPQSPRVGNAIGVPTTNQVRNNNNNEDNHEKY